ALSNENEPPSETRGYATGLSTNTASRRKNKIKRKDPLVEIYGEDVDRDEEGKWTDVAFERLKQKAETNMIEAYVHKERSVDVSADHITDVHRLLFHPDFILLSYNVDRSRFQTMHSAANDGFYVPNPPSTSPRNLERVEKRLIATEPNAGIQWFDPSSCLNVQPDPLALEPRRFIRPEPTILWHNMRTYPDMFYDAEGSLPDMQADELALTRLVKAVPSPFASVEDSPLETYTLAFEIGTLSLQDHPWMSDEMKLARSLESNVSTLSERARGHIIENLDRELLKLRTEYQARQSTRPNPLGPQTPALGPDGIYCARPAMSEESQADETLNEVKLRLQLLDRIKKTRQLRNTEAQCDLLLEFRILQDWEHLQEIRTTKGFSATAVEIQVHTSIPDPDEVLSQT
ncbi:hypothetical protein HKX48_006261, partial [Thoreauomyces humboldtii]